MSTPVGPAGDLLLTGAECAAVAPYLREHLAQVTGRNGATPRQYAAVVEAVWRSARNFERNHADQASPGSAEPRNLDHEAGVSQSGSSGEWVTVKEAAQMLKVSESYVRRLCRQGLLEGSDGHGRGAWRITTGSVVARVAVRSNHQEEAAQWPQVPAVAPRSAPNC